LDIELPWMQQIGRPKSPVRIPVVLSRAEAARLLEQVDPTFAATVALLYGAGLRLMECLRLRVKDLDFDRKILIVRAGKGRKDRAVMLPEPLNIPLRRQLEHSRPLWAEDRARRVPGVAMPDALARKYPRAAESWAWHWVFPSPTLSLDPRSGIRRRHHQYEHHRSRDCARIPAGLEFGSRFRAVAPFTPCC